MNDPFPAHIGQILREGLAALALPESLAAPLLDYLALLQRWNRAYNLTAIRTPEAMVPRHLLDSLALVPFLDGLDTLADLGTGPGLPGIPLALARPSLHVTLIEANGKKARFLREVARTLSLVNVEIVPSRIEAFHPPAPFAAITARALATLTDILTLGGHLLAPHGRLLAMKANAIHEETAALPPGWQVHAIHPLNVPGVEGERHLVIVTRHRHLGA